VLRQLAILDGPRRDRTSASRLHRCSQPLAS
jgi:hypothetical protein